MADQGVLRSEQSTLKANKLLSVAHFISRHSRVHYQVGMNGRGQCQIVQNCDVGVAIRYDIDGDVYLFIGIKNDPIGEFKACGDKIMDVFG